MKYWVDVVMKIGGTVVEAKDEEGARKIVARKLRETFNRGYHMHVDYLIKQLKEVK